jgi:LysR family glycine cleavage system transcriptional activator
MLNCMERGIVEQALASAPLQALRAFVLAARHCSFKQAAAVLSVTPAAVSQQVATLERHLGQTLFKRLNRAIILTAAGEALFRDVDGPFQALGLAIGQQMPTDRRRRRLDLTAASAFASKWLGPRLHDFQSGKAPIDIVLHADDELVDLGFQTQHDIAIRYGDVRSQAGFHIETLWETPKPVVAVCSPEFAKSKIFAGPRAASNPWPLLRVMPPQNAAVRSASKVMPAYADWEAFFRKVGLDEAEARHAIDRAVMLNSTLTALEAAALGRGLALCPLPLVEHDLRIGRLVAPFVESLEDHWRYWIICRKQSLEHPLVRQFLRWLRRQTREEG